MIDRIGVHNNVVFLGAAYRQWLEFGRNSGFESLDNVDNITDIVAVVVEPTQMRQSYSKWGLNRGPNLPCFLSAPGHAFDEPMSILSVKT